MQCSIVEKPFWRLLVVKIGTSISAYLANSLTTTYKKSRKNITRMKHTLRPSVWLSVARPYCQ
jgi:hypothetical protein